MSVWGLIIAGILVLGLFIGWQAINPREPLVPLSLFSDRNFSVSNVAISAMGVVAISMAFPLTLYLQQVEGLDPTQAALMTAPMALFSGALAPVVGARLNRNDPEVDCGNWLYADGCWFCSAAPDDGCGRQPVADGWPDDYSGCGKRLHLGSAVGVCDP